VKSSIEWSGVWEPRIVRSIVRDFSGRYVALLRSGALDRIVNRLQLAERIALNALARSDT
jgi:hypothetical protein